MSWAQLSDRDFLGTSPFQNLCCRDIRKFLPELEFVETGETEKVFVANIPMANIELVLYLDSVVVKSAAGEQIFEAENFEQPEDLVARLIAELSNSI